jgi:hypothetical protein
MLMGRFVQETNEAVVFQPQYHKKIPADGFGHYISSIWVRCMQRHAHRCKEKITQNKDLDLPTQQQLLAQYRCDEIANV